MNLRYPYLIQCTNQKEKAKKDQLVNMCVGGGELHQAFASSACGMHAPTNQPRQPFLSQSAICWFAMA